MPSTQNINSQDFVPDLGGVLTALMPNGYENPLEYPVAATVAIGWLASVATLAIVMLGVASSFTNITFVQETLLPLLSMKVFGVLVVPYFLFTGVIFSSLVHLEFWKFAAEQENLRDDALTMTLYDASALGLLFATDPTSATQTLAGFAEASVFTVVVIGVGAWVVSAMQTKGVVNAVRNR